MSAPNTHTFNETNNNDLKNLTLSKIICVGRNYADHASELGNDVPKTPLLFFKPTTSLNQSHIISIDALTQSNALGELHYECELCIRIISSLSNANKTQAKQAIGAVTLGLDLTLRDLQNQLKTKGHPWERAKAFDNSCILGDWLDINYIDDLEHTEYSLDINQQTKQVGLTKLMLFPIIDLIVDISQQFTLLPGDVIMTGTPKGVGKLHKGDVLEMKLQTNNGVSSWSVNVE